MRHPAFRAADVDATVRELLESEHPPTALFTAQNLITLGALRTLHELGLQDRSRSSASTTSRSLPSCSPA